MTSRTRAESANICHTSVTTARNLLVSQQFSGAVAWGTVEHRALIVNIHKCKTTKKSILKNGLTFCKQIYRCDLVINSLDIIGYLIPNKRALLIHSCPIV